MDDIMFVPQCGHRLCMECSENNNNCPVCNCEITNKIETSANEICWKYFRENYERMNDEQKVSHILSLETLGRTVCLDRPSVFRLKRSCGCAIM